MNCSYAAFIIIWLFCGCASGGGTQKLSYEAKMRRAELALKEDKIFEAKRWTQESLTMDPHNFKAETLMAKILDRQIAREKSLLNQKSPEELTESERELQLKTWLERSRGFLEAHEYDQALLSAEKVFQLDPNNWEASRLTDEIRTGARREGKDESVFLEELYGQEIQSRIEKYRKQTRAWMASDRWGAARLALEKILILDPQDKEAKRLLAELDQKEEPLLTPSVSNLMGDA